MVAKNCAPAGICRLVGAALASVLLSALLLASSASAERTKKFSPVEVNKQAIFFDIDGIRASSVERADLTLRTRGAERSKGPRTRRVSAARVRRAIELRHELRVRRPNSSSGGSLKVEVDPGPKGPGPKDDGPGPQDVRTLLDDTGMVKDASSIWGKVDCASQVRHDFLGTGGDGLLAATGLAQSGDGFRRLTVQDGDDVWGERCELGLNDHRSGPTALYREGEHRITHMSLRLPDNLPLDTSTWQVVMQMKQTQPSANGGGTPVLSLEARAGKWRLMQSTSVEASSDTRELWSGPAAKNLWTRFSFDVVYSQNPSKGYIKVFADLNGDGDTADPSEESAGTQTYTLKREIAGGSSSDGVAAGESIPSHLRVGVYHNPTVPCPSGCSVDVDNVQVLAAS